MASPAISVAMSVFNGERFLAPAIESILAQSFADFEFLILNDGSSDGSKAIIDAYSAQDPRIRAIHRENRGLVASLNQLLDEARGTLVARMDCDDISEPNRFAAQHRFMADHPEYGVVGTWSTDMGEDGAPFAIAGVDHPTSHSAFLDSIRTSGPMLCHPSVMMRRDLVRSVGGYHAAFKHCEDYDLWLRLASVTQMCSIPERLIRYRHWSNQISTKFAYVQQIGAAASYLAWQEREAGRPDPTVGLNELPPLDGFDALFSRAGTAKAIRERVTPTIVYSKAAMEGKGYALMLDHVREGGATKGLWRTIARLMRFGQPMHAVGLFLTLVQH
jgi:glycosyltransferase involved in cell wall biosynthesis